MTRILFVIDTLERGGAEKSILDIVSRFMRYEAVVCMVYPGDALRDRYEASGIRVIALNVSGHYNFSVAMERLQKVIADERPAIVHSTLFRSDIICRKVRKRTAIPLVNSLVNNTYHVSRFAKASFTLRMKLMVVRWMERRSVRYVDQFFSNSETIRDSNSNTLGIPLSKIKVIYRGRFMEPFEYPFEEDMHALREELSLEGRKVLLNVSRLLERKGQLDLLEAMGKVVAQFPDILLLIAGEGPYRSTLEEFIVRNKLQQHVRLLGSRDDISTLLHVADAFVFPSHYEGLPGALIEAMMASTPIVASDIAENMECIRTDEAFVFPVGKTDQLADRIITLLKDPGDAMVRALKAQETARHKFGINAVAAQHEDAYDELLGR